MDNGNNGGGMGDQPTTPPQAPNGDGGAMPPAGGDNPMPTPPSTDPGMGGAPAPGGDQGGAPADDPNKM